MGKHAPESQAQYTGRKLIRAQATSATFPCFCLFLCGGGGGGTFDFAHKPPHILFTDSSRWNSPRGVI